MTIHKVLQMKKVKEQNGYGQEVSRLDIQKLQSGKLLQVLLFGRIGVKMELMVMV